MDQLRCAAACSHRVDLHPSVAWRYLIGLLCNAQVNVFSVFSELQNPLLRRMKKARSLPLLCTVSMPRSDVLMVAVVCLQVMWRSLVLEFLLYGTVAIFG